mmetsp:Transcript_10166/g.37659  ORF Transcript_10166/g.37659 Transcript_10166/m.37659 type:complete len:340 (-) Transcript_10166:573-1592(-)
MESVIFIAAFSAFFTTFFTLRFTSSSGSEPASLSSPFATTRPVGFGGSFLSDGTSTSLISSTETKPPIVVSAKVGTTPPGAVTGGGPLPTRSLRSLRRRVACFRNASWIIPAASRSRRVSSPRWFKPRPPPWSVSRSVMSVRLSKSSVAVTSVSVASNREWCFGGVCVVVLTLAPRWNLAARGGGMPVVLGCVPAVGPARVASRPDPPPHSKPAALVFVSPDPSALGLANRALTAAPCGPPYSEMLDKLAARLVSLMYAAMPPCPSATAKSAAVYPPAPHRAVARMFAPDDKSAATVSSCPFAAAQCSAVRRRRSSWFTSHPLLHSDPIAWFIPSAATQ